MKKALLLIAAISCFAFILLSASGIDWSLAGLREQQNELAQAFHAQPLHFASLFFAFYIIVTALSLPMATILTLAAGAIFGFSKGLIIVSFASTIGASLAFLIARYIARDWIQMRYSNALEKINRKVEEEGALYLFFLRMVPLFPFGLVNVAMAMTPIRLGTYYWVSQLGMLPATMVYVNACAQLASIHSAHDILSGELIFSFLLLGLLPLVTNKFMHYLRQRRAYQGFQRPSHFDYHNIVIGGGAGGLVAAYSSATLQAKVALIEASKMGGDCLNTGCVPSKSILRSAKYVHSLNQAQHYGVAKVDYQLQFADIRQRIMQKIERIAPKDSRQRYRELGVDCIQGQAKVISPWQVEVNGKTLNTRNITIATGARPCTLDLPGLSEITYYTSDTIWSLQELPSELLIIGAGPIGCELAQAFQRLGAQVSMVFPSGHILNREDPELAAVAEEALVADGIELLPHFKSLRCETTAAGSCLIGEQNGNTKQLNFSHLLIAVGRQANLAGLEALALETNEQGRLVSNDTMQTRFNNVYTCGDVTSPLNYTHVAAHQGWYAAANASFAPFKRFRCSLDHVPLAIFTDPEIASLGLNEIQAKQKQIDYKLTRFDMNEIDRAITDEHDTGFIKVLTPVNSDKILGVQIVAEGASELIHEFVLARTHGLGLNKILQSIHLYPSRSEINRFVAGKWRRERFSDRAKQLLQRYQAWRLGQ